MTDWKDRCAEAIRLGPRADESAAAARLLTLLLDPDNTAVSQAAAEALLQRGDLVAVRLVAEAFEVADEDTKNKLGDCLYDDQGTRWASVRSLLDELPDAGHALREHMAREEKEHR
jgi:hypothetical protein